MTERNFSRYYGLNLREGLTVANVSKILAVILAGGQGERMSIITPNEETAGAVSGVQRAVHLPLYGKTPAFHVSFHA